jgi:predicted nucleic acid-binding protein
MLGTFDVVAIEPMIDTDAAAAVHRACRRGGETVRNLTDCLIAVAALRLGAPLLHRDRDFEAIARHTSLETVSGL